MSLERNLSRTHPSEHCLGPLRAPPLFPDIQKDMQHSEHFEQTFEFFKQQQPLNEPESIRPNLFSRVNLLQGQTEGAGMAGFTRSNHLLDKSHRGREERELSFPKGLRYLLAHVFKVPLQTLFNLVAFVYSQCEPASSKNRGLMHNEEQDKVNI